MRELLPFALGLSLALAQTEPREIAGCVTDSTGQALSGVEVAVGVGPGKSAAGHSDEKGCFRIAKAVAGPYQLQLSLRGFELLRLESRQAARVDDFGKLRLAVASIESPVAIEPVRSPEPQWRQQAERMWIPRKLSLPRAYPDAAVQARVQGTVIVRCTLSPSGEVVDARALSGNRLLAAPALETVKGWTFHSSGGPAEPALPNHADVIFAFELAGAGSGEGPPAEFEYPNRVRVSARRR